MSELDERWLPPSPHREKLIETVAKGRAHIEAQGHGMPPLLVYEDGGTMELHRYRWDGDKAVASDGSDLSHGTTRFLDVCGTIDDLKRRLRDEGETLQEDPTPAFDLINDALYMISRMSRRLQQYHEFKEQVREQLGRMDQLSAPAEAPAQEGASRIRAALQQSQDGNDLDALYRDAELIRSVAQQMEDVLYPLREACIEIETLYEKVRGARQWRKR